MTKQYNATAKITEIILQRLEYHASMAVNGHVFRNARVDTYLTPMADQLIATIAWEMAGKRDQMFDETFPLTWWDAVKDRWFPLWLKVKYPPSYRHIKIDRETLYPSIAIPDHEPVIRYAVLDRIHDFILEDDDE